ncbi:MAG: iron-containing alcohol dehydrogenase [Candidatus Obscuribacterales bacterium]|nr:iron-containing alcohol dehydrogenase [Candidatus Obscuribacterales bacterium]
MRLGVFQSPTKVLFGEGTISGIGDEISQFGASKPLLVTDKVLLEKGVLEPVLRSLDESGFGKLPIFSDVPPDSDVECVRQAAAFARQAKADLVIACGGGSVIDTAKVLNIGLSLPGDLLEYEGINSFSQALKPLIAVPTTAGTGSEMSAVAMIMDKANGKKLIFGSRYLYADLAILDPNLLCSLPPRLTAGTGMDALTHCLEAYVSLGANVIADALCLDAMALIFQNLKLATTNGDDPEARANTLLASAMAGMAFTNTGVGIVHALAHTIGGAFGTHHGLTNAVFLPYGMNFNMPSSYERYARCWRHLCSLDPGASGAKYGISAKLVMEADFEKDARSLVKAVSDLADSCSIPKRLRDLGVPELADDKILELAAVAGTDPAIMFNPQEASIEDLSNLIREAY